MSASKTKADQADPIRVRDVVALHRDRQVPMVQRDTPIEDLPKAIEWYRHSRQLYVVDGENRLLGNITLGRLVMYIFASSHGAGMKPRHVMGLITCKTAGDLMTEGTLSVRMEDRVTDVIEDMVSGNVDEAPVVDEKGNLTADLTMIDLLMAGEEG